MSIANILVENDLVLKCQTLETENVNVSNVSVSDLDVNNLSVALNMDIASDVVFGPTSNTTFEGGSRIIFANDSEAIITTTKPTPSMHPVYGIPYISGDAFPNTPVNAGFDNNFFLFSKFGNQVILTIPTTFYVNNDPIANPGIIYYILYDDATGEQIVPDEYLPDVPDNQNVSWIVYGSNDSDPVPCVLTYKNKARSTVAPLEIGKRFELSLIGAVESFTGTYEKVQGLQHGLVSISYNSPSYLA